MGKLVMTVHWCHVLRAPGLGTVNPCIRIVVDSVYKFNTRTKHGVFRPIFDETFTVGNTHRFTVIEVFLCNRGTPGAAVEEEPVLGSCRLSIETLVVGERRRRSYALAAVNGEGGISGTVNIALKTDIPGNLEATMSEALEERCVRRLTRFLLCNDSRCVGDVDLLMASIRRSQASVKRLDTHSSMRPGLASMASQGTYETFDELMENLCEAYGSGEPLNCTVNVVVDGCTDILVPKTYLPSHMIVVLRSISQDFITPQRRCTSNPVWGKPVAVASFDVIDPNTFVLDVMVYIIFSTSKTHEVGRAQVRVCTLTRDYTSSRQVFIYSYEDRIVPRITGIVHLRMKPEGFGLMPMKAAEHVEKFHERLACFFYRYDQLRIQQIDALVNSRLGRLDKLMEELEICYGREPGSMQLWVTIRGVHSLQRDAATVLREKDVVVVVSMGGVKVRTQPKRVHVNTRTTIGDAFVFDVARETDMITFQVVHASEEETIYGRVDFTCLKMQRNVRNDRTLYLIGAAGTTDAYLSGVISVSFQSEQIGQPYAVDTEGDCMYAGRLRRYVKVRAPEKLHLVEIAVATVFDIERFLKDIAREYGEEDPTYAVYVTVLGCRHLRKRLGFNMNAYVVARMGIEWFATRVVQNSTEPDFFEFFEFFVDGTLGAELVLIVMDSYGFGADCEVGRVVIPLDKVQLEHQYHNWIPLEGTDGRNHGVVGVNYTVKDLNLRDTPHFDSKKKTPPMTSRQRNSSLLLKERGGDPLTFRFHFNLLQNKISRAKAQFQMPSFLSNNTSVQTTEFDLVRANDSEFHPFKSLNIMDQSIHSLHEFVSAPNTEIMLHNRRMSHSVEELETVGTLTSRFVPSPNGGMRLHVFLSSCDHLGTQMNLPNPYVMLSTLNVTHTSSVAFGTTSPEYNELFVFHVTDPKEDFLSITVITDTAYGKKCLGHCMLSMKNMQRDTPRVRRAALVVASHSPLATQCGTVCLTLFSENFGLDYTLPIDAENRFRELMHWTLQSRAPAELHRLEWYIGEYLIREDELVDDLLGKYDAKTREEDRITLVSEEDLEMATAKKKKKKKDDVSTETIVSIKNVTGLQYKGRLATCYVKVEVAGKTHFCTRAVPGANGSFVIQEDCHLHILQPMTRTVRLGVYVVSDRKYKCGECVLSLAGLHQNAGRERTHYIVSNAGLPSARAVGYITVLILGVNIDTPALYLSENNEDQYLRMRNYYYYYIRDQLHSVDVHYGRTLNVEAHIHKLTETYGPEPGRYNLRVKILRCRSLALKGGSPYCIIQIGLLHFKTNITHGNEEYVFMETFDIPIGLPEKDEVQLIVMMLNEDTTVDVEAGRTMLSLENVQLGKEVYMKLPLLFTAKTKTRSASLQGFIEVSLFTHDFGVSEELLNTSMNNGSVYEGAERDASAITRSRSFSYNGSAQHMGEMQPASSSVADVQEQAGGSMKQPILIMLIGFRDFPEDEVYIKVKMNNGKTLLRTGGLTGDRLTHINEEFTVNTSIRVEDVILTLKLAVSKLRKSCVLCYCDFMVTHCLPGSVATKWLRLFDHKGKSMGKLCIRVEMPMLVCRSRLSRVSPPTPHELESVVEDLSSLLAKYSPKDLRRLDVMLSRSDNIRIAHAVLRQQLAPRVQSTVYCKVSQTELLNPVRGRRLMVEATVGDDVVCVMERRLTHPLVSPITSVSSVTDVQYPSMRIDITVVDALQLRVLDGDGEEEELGRAVVSLRALLTPQLYDMGELISVPLVKVRRQRNKIQASLAGTLSFSLQSPAFERYPVTAFLLDKSSREVSRNFVSYYLHRICALLKEYDANSLVDIHWVVYEKYVVKDSWAEELPNVLSALIARWGPEIKSFDPPPPPPPPPLLPSGDD